MTAIPRLAKSVGANRIVTGKAIPYPFGNPDLPPHREQQLRRQVVEVTLEALHTQVEQPTVFEGVARG